MSSNDYKLIADEWMQWQKLCGLLLASGAVTKDDLLSPRNSISTKGHQLLQCIREWGHLEAQRYWICNH
jgi:hypothetical protein